MSERIVFLADDGTRGRGCIVTAAESLWVANHSDFEGSFIMPVDKDSINYLRWLTYEHQQPFALTLGGSHFTDTRLTRCTFSERDGEIMQHWAFTAKHREDIN